MKTVRSDKGALEINGKTYDKQFLSTPGSKEYNNRDRAKSGFDEVTNYEKREKPRSKCDPSDRRI